ncbi:hypothetical protein I4U23_023595 [Adineta vaga]|nr:hypothetical protein I4U23_023595 [Adineta vaga]
MQSYYQTKMIVISILFSLLALTASQTCRNLPLYAHCSTNPNCGCLPFSTVDDQSGICAYLHLNSTKLKTCNEHNYYCDQPYTVCVHHPNLMAAKPLCYPTGMATLDICPPLYQSSTSTLSTTTMMTTTTSMFLLEELCANVSWTKEGVTVAGDKYTGTGTNQLRSPTAIIFDSKLNTLYVADTGNARIVTWQSNAKQGAIVAGGNGNGDRLDQFGWISSMLLDSEDGSLVVCDSRNRRIVRWPQGATNAKILRNNLSCSGIAFDSQGLLYVVENDKHRVTRWIVGANLTLDGIVAGNNGKGNGLHQLNEPSNVFVDEKQTVYISDFSNDRIVKWTKDSSEGILIGKIRYPRGIRISSSGNIYAIDGYYSRVIRWTPNDINGTTIIGEKQYTLSQATDLVFDQDGNAYVSNYGTGRVDKFNIDNSECF